MLNFILQIFYFLVSLINDFVGSNEAGLKDRPLIRKIKDFFFTTFAFPLAMNVSIQFWVMYNIDRRTVFPEEVDSFFPSWLNHIEHSLIALFIMVELIVLHREYPSRKEGLGGLLIFLVAYLAWMHVTRYFAGRWAYPIVDALNIPGRIGFFTLGIIFPVLMYFLGEYLSKKFWSDNRVLKSQAANEVKGIL